MIAERSQRLQPSVDALAERIIEATTSGRPFIVGGVWWWNVKHPARYAAALASGLLPGGGLAWRAGVP